MPDQEQTVLSHYFVILGYRSTDHCLPLKVYVWYRSEGKLTTGYSSALFSLDVLKTRLNVCEFHLVVVARCILDAYIRQSFPDQ